MGPKRQEGAKPSTKYKMQRFSEFLTEQVRPQHLYHGTGILNALQIIDENVMGPQGHTVKHNGKVYQNLTSLSRTYRFAYTFAKARTFQPVVFELDRVLLQQKYKLLPYSFTRMQKITFPDPSFPNQMEEMVVGPIELISKYITRVIVDSELELTSMRDMFDAETRQMVHKLTQELWEHPKLFLWKEQRYVNGK